MFKSKAFFFLCNVSLSSTVRFCVVDYDKVVLATNNLDIAAKKLNQIASGTRSRMICTVNTGTVLPTL